MTSFDATTPEERRTLVADAIRAHRERGSAFCTVEGDSPPDQGAAGGDRRTADGDGEGTAPDPTPAWVQYSASEEVLNLDCTDEEYDRVVDVLASFPEFTVAEQTSPEDAEGRNLRIAAGADVDRIGAVVERLFLEGFGYEEGFRLWATEI